MQMQTNEFLSFDQTLSLIKAVGHKRTVIVMGENGVGKTSLHKALSQDQQFEQHHKLAPIDCTQLSDGSVWGPDIDRERGVYRELPNERLGLNNFNHKGVDGAKPVLGMFDEIAKIPQYVKNMIAPILYERRVGTLLMPEGSVWFAATNLAAEGLGDSLAAHLRNRLVVVKMRKPTVDEWINNFAIPNKLHPVLLACVQEYSQVFDSFVDYLDGGKFEGKDLEKDNPYIFNPRIVQEAYASPRSLHAASDVLYATESLGDDIMRIALEGTIGKPFTSVLTSFIRFGQQLPPISQIKANPETATIPSNKIAQQVQVFQFISRAETREDAEAFVKYLSRLQPEIQSLFCRRVSESNRIGLFASVAEFGRMVSDNKIFYKV
jgi:GTPase SAR1 family protein